MAMPRISKKELWNVDLLLAKHIAFILDKFVNDQELHGYPSEFKSMSAYKKKILSITKALAIYVNKDKITTDILSDIEDRSLKFVKDKNGCIILDFNDMYTKEELKIFKKASKTEAKIIKNYKKALHDLADLAPTLWD